MRSSERLIWTAVFLCVTFVTSASAQGPAPDEQLGLAPYQSYHGGDIDNVNLSNGNLNIRIPLLSYPQRGGVLKENFSIVDNQKQYKVKLLCPPQVECTKYWFGSVGSAGAGIADDQSLGAGATMVTVNHGSSNSYYYFATIASPDGASHQTGQTAGSFGVGQQGWTNSTYESLDGTDIHFSFSTTAPQYTIIDSAGITYYPSLDGPTYNGAPVWKKDTNGNIITKTSAGVVTDTVGRAIPAAVTGQSTSNCPQGPLTPVAASLWTPPGYNGGTYRILMCYATVAINIPPGPADNGLTINARALQSIVFLDDNNASWNFEYNDTDGQNYNNKPDNYGTLTKITFPTGGSISYTYTTVTSPMLNDLGSRWVASRTVDANDGTVAHTWQYAYTPGSTTTVTDPEDNDTVHTFTMLAAYSPYETETDYYQGPQSSNQLLKSVTTLYHSISMGGFGNSAVNVFPTTIKTTLPNAGTNYVRQEVNTYDTGFAFNDFQAPPPAYYGKVLTKTESDYGTGGVGSTIKKTTTGYQAFDFSSYLSKNLLNLVDSSYTYDGSGNTISGTTYSYDENNGSPQCACGNQTSVTRWLNTGTSPKSQTVYNSQGMPTSKIDPKQNSTYFYYDSTGAFLHQVKYPPTSGVAHNETYTFDTNTGLMTSHTDQNGQPTSYNYDALLRIQSITYPPSQNGLTGGGSDTFTYTDTPGSVSVELQRSIDTSRSTTEEVLFDGFGRQISVSKANGESTPYDRTDTCYDARGLKSFSSYPYQSASDTGWSVCPSSNAGDSFLYDALKRPTTVTHSDGSSVTTSYYGPATKVADEGNGSTSIQTISQEDGIGRLKSVCEVTSTTPAVGPAPAACNQALAATGFLTTYSYAGLGDLKNLTGVTQSGLNARSFSYDSLSQLLTATNPESGTVCYGTYSGSTCVSGYDANGNLLSRTRSAPNGAGGTVTTSYAYDALNRLTTITYSDGATPKVTYNYDETTSAVGALTNTTGRKSSEKVTDSGGHVLSAGVYTYDPMGRVATNWQCTPQTCPGTSYYSVGYGWNYIGDMTALSDGSSATSYSYSTNLAQRITGLSSSLNDQNHPPAMFSGVSYNAFGSVTADSFGNGATESFTYYPRGWLAGINAQSPNPGSNTPSTGSVSLSGAEQNVKIPNTSGSGTVTLSGSDGVFIDPDTFQRIYDSGTITVTVNGSPYQTSYNQSSTATGLATTLAGLINGSSVVTASASAGVITITARQKGSGTNYSLSANASSNNSDDFPNGSFHPTPSGSTLSGGSDTTIYDTGTVTITVGSGHETVNYGQNSTPSSITSALVSAFNNDQSSLVTATVFNGTTVNLTSKAGGSGTDYTLSASSSTGQGQYFSSSSFGGSPSGGTMTGGESGEATVYTLNMSYAPNGDVLTANDMVNGRWVYTYDPMNRLATSNMNSGQVKYTYDIDRYGNRWHQNLIAGNGNTVLYSFDNNNRITGSNISYDALGNVTNDGLGHTFTYDAENRIIGVGGSSASYVYGANGERVRKVAGSTYDYIYDLSGHVITELSGGAVTRSEVFAGGQHLATYASGTTYFSHSDWLGTERVRTSASGPACESITSLPYGDGMGTTGTCEPSPLHFTGKQRDLESGLDDFPARYYSSIQGRWMTADWSVTPEPVPYAKLENPQSLNLYAYVGNDPTNHPDPDGHSWNTTDDNGKAAPNSPGCTPYDKSSCPDDKAKDEGLLDKAESALENFAHAEGDFFTTAAKEFDSLATFGLTPDASANNSVEKAAVGAGVIMSLAVPGGEGETLTRLGTSTESASRLARKAAEAEEKIGIHGVSATAAKVEGEVSRAARGQVERVFNVHNTPTHADQLHRTIELPKPVTKAVADMFNKLFGRGI
jgi:RHS repeat-associated protein